MSLRLVIELQFNRTLKPVSDHISVGGYEMNGVQFDFEDYEYFCNKDENMSYVPGRLLVHLKNPDYDCFPNMGELEYSEIESIEELYVDTDEEYSLIRVSFYDTEDMDMYYNVSNEVINKFNSVNK